MLYLYQHRKLFAETLIVTEEIYDVRESDNCPRTFHTDFVCKSFRNFGVERLRERFTSTLEIHATLQSNRWGLQNECDSETDTRPSSTLTSPAP